jgi:hypothetical protein
VCIERFVYKFVPQVDVIPFEGVFDSVVMVWDLRLRVWLTELNRFPLWGDRNESELSQQVHLAAFLDRF